MRIITVAGARPNFIKIAPLMWRIRQCANVEPFLIHTGQHYDVQMSGQFFQDLNIPPPDVSLEVGSGSHAYQTAEVMRKIEPVLEEIRPDVVVVVGDVNSTVAAALTAAKLHIPVAHVEAGLRSFDRTMPEEINRIVTDAVSDYLFVSEESGVKNLRREGVAEEKIHFVGNVMIDSLEASRRLWERSTMRQRIGLEKKAYGIVTLHRPSNVDDPDIMQGLVEALAEIANQIPILFPMHPRTKNRIKEFNLQHYFQDLSLSPKLNVQPSALYCLEPLGYLDFMALMADARLVLTDSGGVQEETTILGVPCLTLRENTERPVTVSHGTNGVIGVVPEKIIAASHRILQRSHPPVACPPLWDGHASERIIAVLTKQLA
jgi:UDP-N-acetylglucosamine 2-epimerase (non-hydrolysing)